jgi:hypothetical protein
MKFLVVVAVLAVIAQAYSPKYTGTAWQSQASDNKEDTLYNAVMADTTSNGWYSAVHLAELFIENLNTSFSYVGDDMPGQNLFNLEERPKLIHSVGTVSQIQYIDLGGHNFTGVFKGCQNGFLRLSLATPPDAKIIVPGLSLKFMRNGVPSGNVFAMYSLNGQSSFNFFKHDLSNHAPQVNINDPNIPFAKKMLFNAFSKVSTWPTWLGVNDLGKYDQYGNTVANPVFPFRVIFHPVTAIHSLFPDAPQSGDSFFLNQLETLAPGPIYEVYAQPTPYSNLTIGPIGRIDGLTSPSSSLFGDRDMYFQHTRMEDDFNLNPAWVAPAKNIQTAQGSAVPPYAYPDLPWK